MRGILACDLLVGWLFVSDLNVDVETIISLVIIGEFFSTVDELKYPSDSDVVLLDPERNRLAMGMT
jgi:hypothetical protein